MSSSPDFDLISSTRYAPGLRDVAWNTDANAGVPSPFLLLRYHYDRLLDAAKVHAWPIPRDISLARLQALCEDAVARTNNSFDTPAVDYRIRVLYSYAGSLSVTATIIPSLPCIDLAALSLWLPTSSVIPPFPHADPLDVFLDTVPTPSSLFTRTKTTYREHYTAARSRFGIPPPPTSSLREVLLFNERGEITETSIRNVAFVRRSPPRWVTPSSSTGCLPGVMRRWLLERDRVTEAAAEELTLDGIVDGECILLFNGVEGCRIGHVRISK
ncbi:aminotransferase [Trametes polyzona]|nr:aminotransferase [Trametes polyzona]